MKVMPCNASRKLSRRPRAKGGMSNYGDVIITRCMARIRIHAVLPALLESGAAHRDAAEAITTDLAGGTEREVQHPALRIRPAILHGAIDLLAVLEIGDDEDGAERLGAMRAGDFMG